MDNGNPTGGVTDLLTVDEELAVRRLDEPAAWLRRFGQLPILPAGVASSARFLYRPEKDAYEVLGDAVWVPSHAVTVLAGGTVTARVRGGEVLAWLLGFSEPVLGAAARAVGMTIWDDDGGGYVPTSWRMVATRLPVAVYVVFPVPLPEVAA